MPPGDAAAVRRRRRVGPALAAVALLTGLAAALRAAVATQSLFADELSTWWIVTQHGLPGVVSTVHSNAEITPPLFFVLSWLAAQIGSAAEWVRAPSLLAGVATVPLVWALGRRVAGARAGVAAAGLTAFAPFMVYYAAEARGYAVAMALVALSTLALLLALDTARRRWWAVHALATCGAMYSHYTCVFALGAQFAWVLWTHPEARRATLVATAAAALGFAPWLTGVRNDFTSPTQGILDALSPFTLESVAGILGHWTVGYPYASLPLAELPGRLAVVAVAAGLALGLAGLARRGIRRPPARLVLVAALALSLPVGEALLSLVGTNLFGVRNLAASWPALAVLLGAVLTSAGPRLGLAAAGLAVGGLAVGGLRMLEPRFGRPAYGKAAAFVGERIGPQDALVDQTGVLSPGPPTGLDVELPAATRAIRAGFPGQRARPFAVEDRVQGTPAAMRRAAATARGGRIFLVGNRPPRRADPAAHDPPPPPGYRLAERRRWPGAIADVVAVVYAREG